MSYPTDIDNFQDTTADEYLGDAAGIGVSAILNNHNDAIEALEAKVGTDGSADTDSVDHKLATVISDLNTDEGNLSTHIADTANPHSVTKTQVGLGNVDNTSDANKPVSTAQQTALNLKADIAQEAWHEIGATGEPAFQNSWVNYGNNYNTAGFMKLSNGMVCIKGLVKNGTTDVAAFTLPEGYRPIKDILVAATAAGSFGQLIVASDGQVKVYCGANNGFCQVDWTFYADQ
jgi:hypothetical protein